MEVQDVSVPRKEIVILLAKDAIEPVPPAEMRQGLHPLLHRTQERRCPSANPGSVSLELGPSQDSVQDIDAGASIPRIGLQSEGCLPSCLFFSSAWAVLMVCIRRSGMAVQGPPLRAVPVHPLSLQK